MNYMFLVRVPPSRLLLLLHRRVVVVRPPSPRSEIAAHSAATAFNQDLSSWTVPVGMSCTNFAAGATAWLAAYPPGTGGSIASTPPLSVSMIAAGCGP